MSNRRRLARERLEIYLVHLILMCRRLTLIVGLLLLAYAVTTIFVDQVAGLTPCFPPFSAGAEQHLQRRRIHRPTWSMDSNTLEA